MSRYRRGCLYVRRLRLGDKADSFMLSMQMAAQHVLAERRGGSAYVLVRHGSDRVMSVGPTKAYVKACLLSRHPDFKSLSRAWRDDDARAPRPRKGAPAP